jgi:hypothetical protein
MDPGSAAHHFVLRSVRGTHKAVDDLATGIRHCPLLREMVYDSFMTGRAGRPCFLQWT